MIAQQLRSADSQSSDLEQRVILFLQQRHLVFGCRLWVEAADGVVTLSGRVPTFHQRQLIYAFTRRVAGVLQVVDLLEVDPPIAPNLSAAGGTAVATVLI
jgi:osmotically-inducible protein OsmY